MTETYTAKVRPEKAEAVAQIKTEFAEAPAVVLTDYRGLSVQALADLRSRLRGVETSYRVVKNTLARRAAGEAGFGELAAALTGPTAVAYVKGDPVAAAKVLAGFARNFPELVIKGGVLDGRVLSAEEMRDLATVDVLDVSRAKIAGLLTAALRQIASTLEAPARQILFALEELGKRAPAAEDAPAAEEAPAAAEAEAPTEEAGPETTAEVWEESEGTTEETKQGEEDGES